MKSLRRPGWHESQWSPALMRLMSTQPNANRLSHIRELYQCPVVSAPAWLYAFAHRATSSRVRTDARAPRSVAWTEASGDRGHLTPSDS